MRKKLKREQSSGVGNTAKLDRCAARLVASWHVDMNSLLREALFHQANRRDQIGVTTDEQ